MLERRQHGIECNVQLAANEIGEHRGRSAVGNMHDVDASHHLEQFAGHVLRAAIARRAHVELPGIGLGVGDELGAGPSWHRRGHLHDEGVAHDARNGRNIPNEVEV